MSDDDCRQQQELERERMLRGLEVLQRICRGLHSMNDVWYLAAELGLTTEFRKSQERKAA